MVTEVISILATSGGAFAALLQPKQQRAALRRSISRCAAAGLINLVVLGVSGLWPEVNGVSAAIHFLTGHLMLPLVATATGLWLGASLPVIIRRPLWAVPRLLFLLLLCFCCLSNTWTGYFGPSRVDALVEPETYNRFLVIHQRIMPVLIGSMLLFCCYRLNAGAGPVTEREA
jgi:hypothetical protein